MKLCLSYYYQNLTIRLVLQYPLGIVTRITIVKSGAILIHYGNDMANVSLLLMLYNLTRKNRYFVVERDIRHKLAKFSSDPQTIEYIKLSAKVYVWYPKLYNIWTLVHADYNGNLIYYFRWWRGYKNHVQWLICDDLLRKQQAFNSFIIHYLIMVTCINYENVFILPLSKSINTARVTVSLRYWNTNYNGKKWSYIDTLW